MDGKGGRELPVGRRLQGKKAALGEGVTGGSFGGRFLLWAHPTPLSVPPQGQILTGPVPFAASEMKTRLGQRQNQLLLQETELINPPHDLHGDCRCPHSNEPSSLTDDGTQT